MSPILLIHHLKKNGPVTPYAAPELEDLAFAGFAEWARQWILLGRREAFDPEKGMHRLWMNVGGSAGHHGAWAADIDEGVMDENFAGKKWDVVIQKASEAKNRAAETRKTTTQSSQRLRVMALLGKNSAGLTFSAISDRCEPKINKAALRNVLDDLESEGLIAPAPLKINGKTHDGFVLIPSVPGF